MNLARPFRRWLRTRDPRLLRRGIPAVLGFVAWLVFGTCLFLWSSREAESRYAGIADKALATKNFETARIATQRLLGIGCEPRRKHLFDLALSLGGLGRDKDAV